MTRTRLIAIRTTFVLMLVANTYFSLAPELPAFIPPYDKLNHGAAYAVLALTADFAFPLARYLLPKALPLFAYGLLMEILQRYVPGRLFEGMDLVANASGLLLYGVAAVLLRRHGEIFPTR